MFYVKRFSTFPLDVLVEVSRFLQGSRVFISFPSVFKYVIFEVDRVDYRYNHQTDRMIASWGPI